MPQPCSVLRSDVYHVTSDLTGYLWSEVKIKDDHGHDVYRAIVDNVGDYYSEARYLCMRFEIIKKG